jgi:hypothetical protein
MWFDT